jgi:hypothetical protein
MIMDGIATETSPAIAPKTEETKAGEVELF